MKKCLQTPSSCFIQTFSVCILLSSLLISEGCNLGLGNLGFGNLGFGNVGVANIGLHNKGFLNSGVRNIGFFNRKSFRNIGFANIICSNKIGFLCLFGVPNLTPFGKKKK